MAPNVRQFDKEKDFDTVKAWWEAHSNGRLFAKELLPPVGVIAEVNGEPLAACWVHLSAGVGVAFLDLPVSKPGLPLKEVQIVFSVLLEAIEEICRAHDYGMLQAFTLPGIARHLQRRHGFEHAGTRLQLVKMLRSAD